MVPNVYYQTYFVFLSFDILGEQPDRHTTQKPPQDNLLIVMTCIGFLSLNDFLSQYIKIGLVNNKRFICIKDTPTGLQLLNIFNCG